MAVGGLWLAAPAQPDANAPVAAPITADPPDGIASATIILVHGGGWAGHSVAGQQLLMKRVGELFVQRDWRVVSIDYEEGAAGLQDVLDTIEAEIARKTSSGPLCLYGESSGAHLALVAASRVGALVDCVIGLGTPADLSAYDRTDTDTGAGAKADEQVRYLANRIHDFFGTTAAEIAAWNPVALASSIGADVLLMREADDFLVAAEQSKRFEAAHPETRVVELDSTARGDPSAAFLHGTLSDAGEARYASTIASFSDRALAAPAEERRAARARVGVLQSKRTPITWVHSIALSAARVRALIAPLGPAGS